MRVVLFTAASKLGVLPKALQELLGKSGHCLEYRALGEVQTCDLKFFDMVLLDGNSRSSAAQDCLMEAAQYLRCAIPRIPIVVLSAFDSTAGLGGTLHGCRVTAAGKGGWNMHCRLKELAWRESEALLHDIFEHEPLQPVSFEYRGYARRVI